MKAILLVFLLIGCVQQVPQDIEPDGIELFTTKLLVETYRDGELAFSRQLAFEMNPPVQVMNRWQEHVLAYQIVNLESGTVDYLDGSFHRVRYDRHGEHSTGEPLHHLHYANAGDLFHYGIFWQQMIANGTIDFASHHDAYSMGARGTGTLHFDWFPFDYSQFAINMSQYELISHTATYDGHPVPVRYDLQYLVDGEPRRLLVNRQQYAVNEVITPLPPATLDVDTPGEPIAARLFGGDDLEAYYSGFSWQQFFDQFDEPVLEGCRTQIHSWAFYWEPYGVLRPHWQIFLTWQTVTDATLHRYSVQYEMNPLPITMWLDEPWSSGYGSEATEPCRDEHTMHYTRSVQDAMQDLWEYDLKSGGPCGWGVYPGQAIAGTNLNRVHSNMHFVDLSRGGNSTGYHLNANLNNNAWEGATLHPDDVAAFDAQTMQKNRPAPGRTIMSEGPYCQAPIDEEFPSRRDIPSGPGPQGIHSGPGLPGNPSEPVPPRIGSAPGPGVGGPTRIY